MLCHSGVGDFSLKDLNVEVRDEGNRWMTKVRCSELEGIDLGNYLDKDVLVPAGSKDTYSVKRRSQGLCRVNCYHIAFETLKAVIGCIGKYRSTPYEKQRLEFDFKNTSPFELGHTEEMGKKSVIIRIDLEKHRN